MLLPADSMAAYLRGPTIWGHQHALHAEFDFQTYGASDLTTRACFIGTPWVEVWIEVRRQRPTGSGFQHFRDKSAHEFWFGRLNVHWSPQGGWLGQLCALGVAKE